VLLTSKEWRQLLSPSTLQIVALAPGPSSYGWMSSSCGCAKVMSVNVKSFEKKKKVCRMKCSKKKKL
jgi:hypothetical protein